MPEVQLKFSIAGFENVLQALTRLQTASEALNTGRAGAGPFGLAPPAGLNTSNPLADVPGHAQSGNAGVASSILNSLGILNTQPQSGAPPIPAPPSGSLPTLSVHIASSAVPFGVSAATSGAASLLSGITGFSPGGPQTPSSPGEHAPDPLAHEKRKNQGVEDYVPFQPRPGSLEDKVYSGLMRRMRPATYTDEAGEKHEVPIRLSVLNGQEDPEQDLALPDHLNPKKKFDIFEDIERGLPQHGFRKGTMRYFMRSEAGKIAGEGLNNLMAAHPMLAGLQSEAGAIAAGAIRFAGPLALAAGAISLGTQGAEAYEKYSDPSFNTRLGIQAQQESGEYVNPYLINSRMAAAKTEGYGNLMSGYAHGALANIFSLGTAGITYNLTTGRTLAELGRTQDAKGEDDLLRQELSAQTGGEFGDTPTQSRPVLEKIRLLKEKEILQRPFALQAGAVAWAAATGNGTLAHRLMNDSVGDVDGRLDYYNKQAAKDTSTDSARLQIAREFGGLAIGNQSAIKGYDLSTYTTPENAAEGFGVVSRTIQNPAFVKYQRAILDAGGDQGKFNAAIATATDVSARQLAAQGDIDGLRSLREQIESVGKAAGRSKDDIDKYVKGLLDTGLQVRDLTNSIQVAQGRASGVQIDTQMVMARGGTAQEAARTLGGELPFLKEEKDDLYQKALKFKDTGDMGQYYSYLNQSKQAGLQIQQLPRQMYEQVTQADAMFAQAKETSAQMDYQRANFGGTEAHVYAGFQKEIKAGQAEIRVAERRALTPNMSPQERAEAEAQLQQTRFSTEVMFPRMEGAFRRSMRDIGLQTQSNEASGSTRYEQLTGSPEDIFKAQSRQAELLQARIANEQSDIKNAARDKRTPEEVAGLKAALAGDTAELKNALIENTRGLFANNTALASATATYSRTSLNMQEQYLGLSGRKAVGGILAQAGDADADFSAASAELSAYVGDKNSAGYKALKQKVLEKQGAAIGSYASAAEAPYQLSDQSQLSALRFQQNVMTQTFASYGNMRGNLEGQMGVLGKEAQQNQSSEQRELAALRNSPAYKALTDDEKHGAEAQVAFTYQQKQQQLGQEMVGVQSNLQSGWLDRLISQTYNAPGRFSLVAAGFTARESSAFTQAMSPVFGESGPQGRENQQYWLNRGSRMGNPTSLAGLYNHPDQYLANAASGGTGTHDPHANPGFPAHRANSSSLPSGILHPGGRQELLVRVVVTDPSGKQIGKGSASTTLHDVRNNRELIIPSHSTTQSHQ